MMKPCGACVIHLGLDLEGQECLSYLPSKIAPLNLRVPVTISAEESDYTVIFCGRATQAHRY